MSAIVQMVDVITSAQTLLAHFCAHAIPVTNSTLTGERVLVSEKNSGCVLRVLLHDFVL